MRKLRKREVRYLAHGHTESKWQRCSLNLGHLAPESVHLRCCCCCCVASVVSDSVRPHRRQPTRLHRPWDSPGKNTGVGRHFLLQCMKVKSEREIAQSCPTLSDPMDCSLPGSSIDGIFQARVLEWGASTYATRQVECKQGRWEKKAWLPPSKKLYYDFRNFLLSS